MRKHLALTALLLPLISCTTPDPITLNTANQIRPSYKLEDLCDTPVEERELTLNVHIEPSEDIWDYHEHREELFGYIQEFFAEYKIKCKIRYRSSPLEEHTKPNEIGVEIRDSEPSISKRSYELSRETTDESIKGRAITTEGIALVNGGWEEFRGKKTRKEIKELFSITIEEMTMQEYILRNNANLITHEILHCLGLFHPNEFSPDLINTYENEIPNIMSYASPEFSSSLVLGANMTSLQERLIHSYIAGNGSFKAFVGSHKDMNIYLENIAKDNNIKLTQPNIVTYENS